MCEKEKKNEESFTARTRRGNGSSIKPKVNELIHFSPSSFPVHSHFSFSTVSAVLHDCFDDEFKITRLFSICFSRFERKN